jgi:hypothetical protein
MKFQSCISDVFWFLFGKAETSEPSTPVSQFARQNRGPLKARPQEKQSTLERLSRQFFRSPKILAEVSLQNREDFTSALAVCCPTMKITFFQKEELVSIAILEIVDKTELGTLLEQDWLVGIDLSQVAFGNPKMLN